MRLLSRFQCYFERLISASSSDCPCSRTGSLYIFQYVVTSLRLAAFACVAARVSADPNCLIMADFSVSSPVRRVNPDPAELTSALDSRSCALCCCAGSGSGCANPYCAISRCFCTKYGPLLPSSGCNCTRFKFCRTNVSYCFLSGWRVSFCAHFDRLFARMLLLPLRPSLCKVRSLLKCW